MPKYVHVAAHLTLKELEQQYRKANNPVQRSHFQMIWLLARGKHICEVAEMTGYCANWIRILARRYNQQGPAALADQRQHNVGTVLLLSETHQQQLLQVLEQALPDAGLWSGPKVALWMGKQLGRTVSPQRGWEYLKRVGFSLQVPRPRHHKADRTEQELFKRELPEQVQLVQYAHPNAQGERMAQWTSIGSVSSPSSDVSGRAEDGARLFGYNNGMSGSTCMGSCIPNRERASGSCSLQSMLRPLVLPCSTLLRRLELAQSSIVYWYWIEQAGTEAKRSLFQRVSTSCFSRPDCPELQPCERLWPLSNEAIAHRRFASLDELQEAQSTRCVVLQDDPLSLRRHALFHWWPPSRSEEQDGVVS